MSTSTLGTALVLAASVAGAVGARGATLQMSDTTAASNVVKFTGCLERDAPVASASAGDASAITTFRLTGVDAASLKNALGSAGAALTGPPALRLLSTHESELYDRLDRRVEVTGRLIDEGPEARKLVVVTAQGSIGWTPAMRVSSVRTIAPACK